MTAQRVLTEQELAALVAEATDGSSFGLGRWPLPAVLDTDFVRTGLHYQVRNGMPPRSVKTAKRGSLRLFMEYDTLTELGAKLPKFAGQLGVSVADLRRMLNEDWLPHVDVVKLPATLRQTDPRAMLVRERDPKDYPAAALAALLSPCLLLTRNYKHFGALGVRTSSQGVDGVMAVVAINIGELQVRAIVMVPAAPVMAAGAAIKWASDRFGPGAWIVLGLLIGGGIFWYRQQSPERRAQMKQVAGQISARLLQEFGTAADCTYQAHLTLRASLVPSPEQRTPVSAMVRELALSPQSLSAQQLAELLDQEERPSVADVRAFLRTHDDTVFRQVRRGGFVVGSRYRLPG